eukprot:5806786-Amphidinium_carterae.1
MKETQPTEPAGADLSDQAASAALGKDTASAALDSQAASADLSTQPVSAGLNSQTASAVHTEGGTRAKRVRIEEPSTEEKSSSTKRTGDELDDSERIERDTDTAVDDRSEAASAAMTMDTDSVVMAVLNMEDN